MSEAFDTKKAKHGNECCITWQELMDPRKCRNFCEEESNITMQVLPQTLTRKERSFKCGDISENGKIVTKQEKEKGISSKKRCCVRKEREKIFCKSLNLTHAMNQKTEITQCSTSRTKTKREPIDIYHFECKCHARETRFSCHDKYNEKCALEFSETPLSERRQFCKKLKQREGCATFGSRDKGKQSNGVGPPRSARRTKCPKYRHLDSNVMDIWNLELLTFINASRAAHNTHHLSLNSNLSAAAMWHNMDQALVRVETSHKGTDGSDLTDRIREQGYKYLLVGENVAAGQNSPKEVHLAFMDSPGHAKNVLNPSFKEVGIHVCKGLDGRIYWTEEFGVRKTP